MNYTTPMSDKSNIVKC